MDIHVGAILADREGLSFVTVAAKGEAVTAVAHTSAVVVAELENHVVAGLDSFQDIIPQTFVYKGTAAAAAACIVFNRNRIGVEEVAKECSPAPETV